MFYPVCTIIDITRHLEIRTSTLCTDRAQRKRGDKGEHYSSEPKVWTDRSYHANDPHSFQPLVLVFRALHHVDLHFIWLGLDISRLRGWVLLPHQCFVYWKDRFWKVCFTFPGDFLSWLVFCITCQWLRIQREKISSPDETNHHLVPYKEFFMLKIWVCMGW